METTNREESTEQEWQWCLVGNIVGKHEYGVGGGIQILLVTS